MKTVHLPIYEDGIMLNDYLEVELDFFISSTRGLRSNQARVREFQLAQWELDLLNSAKVEITNAETLHGDWDKEQQRYADGTKSHLCEGGCAEVPAEDEWRIIEGLPISSLEINEKGIIRHRKTKRVFVPKFDTDYLEFKVFVDINGVQHWLDGPKLAKAMWSDDA